MLNWYLAQAKGQCCCPLTSFSGEVPIYFAGWDLPILHFLALDLPFDDNGRRVSGCSFILLAPRAGYLSHKGKHHGPGKSGRRCAD